MAAELTYLIWEGILAGRAGGRAWFVTAMSGGAGGSTRLRPTPDANNPYSSGLKTAGGVRGGPLPPGRYRIGIPHHDPDLHGILCARLTPLAPRGMMGRGGFYIHGRGPKGSDGCIVPLDRRQFYELMDALVRDHGGTLRVMETNGDVAFA